ncbi:nuclear cap-binding protein subunit 1 isoform X2 [Drosophila biarmipes]|uniref:nuclear cap-binding protein subunit 1 isoform X2 n=1 Tax=Drosophila biarmipes TaxID=125945 RepID=UPI0007E87A99|nr:nuclear cap-binding protein subunit 1 isoform X2 [Drosophila biarmipes]
MEPGRRKRADWSGDEEDDSRRKRMAEDKLVAVDRWMRSLSYQGGNSIELKLENLSYLLRNEISAELRKHILQLLIACVGTHPWQSSAYATFVGLLNIVNFEFAYECLTFMMQKLHESICNREWYKVRGVVHFLVDLYNCHVVTSSSLLSFLAGLVKECENVKDPDDVDPVPQTRLDWLAYCVLSAVPLIGRDLQGKAEFEGIMLTLQIYIKKRSILPTAVLGIWRDSKQRDYLDLLWQRVDDMRRELFAEPEHQLIPRPYLAFDEALSIGPLHILRDFQVTPHEPKCPYPPPRVSFCLFSSDIGDEQRELPHVLRIERHLMEIQIQDILNSQHLERRSCADNLLAYAASKSQLAVYHSIVEVILGEMLHLPASQWININYGALLVELCKRQPEKVPRVVDQAALILFDRLDYMSVACFDRLVNWLSFHLSNFGFAFYWDKWGRSVRSPIDPSVNNLQPKAVFLRELIKKCVRLSYPERIVEILPDFLAGFLPRTSIPHFKFVDETLPGAMLSKNLLEAMRSKQSCPEMISTIINSTTGIGPLLKINVLTQNCLYLGSKSFSHTYAILCKYHSVLKEMEAPESEKQHAILGGLFELWVDSDQYKLVVSERLIRMKVIEPRSMVSWILGPQMRKELTKMYAWELLHSTVRHVRRVQQQTEVVDVDCPSEAGCAVRGILLDIVNRSVKALSAAPEEQEGSEEQYWFHWVLGRLQETLFIYAADYKNMSCKLEKISAEGDLRESISKTIRGFLAYVKA